MVISLNCGAVLFDKYSIARKAVKMDMDLGDFSNLTCQICEAKALGNAVDLILGKM